MSANDPVESEQDEPYAEIQRVGRWTYHITVRHGLSITAGGWFALGRRAARRKARRKLRDYVQSQMRAADCEMVGVEEIES